MNLTLLQAHSPLRKNLIPLIDLIEERRTDQGFPQAATFVTHTHEVTDIDQYFSVIRDGAHRGFCLLKGVANRELHEYSSRRGLADRDAKTELLILDIDGLPYSFEERSKMTQKDVFRAAETIICHLPDIFHKVSYVAIASSNFGRKPGLRLHLHFLLSAPTDPALLKKLIMYLNLECTFFSEHLRLSNSGRQLKYVVDPCVADNSRLIYIAPPEFSVPSENPFACDSERFCKVNRIEERLDIGALKSVLSNYPIERAKQDRLKALCKKSDIDYVEAKFKSHLHAGRQIRVLNNPEFVQMEIAEVSELFVRYNVNGGDSNAYWVWMEDPEVVYSFKPDEHPFLFKAANPEVYKEHCKRFRREIEKAAAVENGVGQKVMPLVVFNRNADAYFTVEYDPFNDVVWSLCSNHKSNAENWLKDLGFSMPNPVPAYSIVFDPTKAFGHDAERQILNTFRPSNLITHAPMFDGDPLKFVNIEDWMEANTPICYAIISNMVGDDSLCFAHFMNWFAFIVQRREKPETAWVVHGVEGTGKGLFIKRIAKPILGPDYVVEKKLSDMAEDKYNGYLEEALLVFVDEFNVNGTRSGLMQTVNMLKQQITQSTLSIRKMQRNPEQKQTYFGMVFATNDIDAMRLSPTDRRYNICPRQENKLISRFPDLNVQRNYYDSLIDAELPTLVSMLLSLDIDEHRVRTPLSNEAKTLAMHAGMVDEEVFFNALKQGDLDFFLPVLDMKLPRNPNLIHIQCEAKMTIKGWLSDYVLGQPSKIEKRDLLDLFVLMLQPVSEVAFGRKCKQHGLVETQFRINDKRFRGFSVNWINPPLDEAIELLENESRRTSGVEV